MSRRFPTLWLAFVLVFATMVVVAPGASAEERTCRGSLGAITVDNLRVPSDATCTLNGTYIKGTLKVERNATLHAYKIRVNGNIQAENHRAVNVYAGSTIGGSIQIKQGQSAQVLGSRVNADIQYDSNKGALKANDNRVGGNIQVMKNTGGVQINKNTVDGNLQCKENSPAPTGSGNIVKGNKEDQCRRL